MISIDQKYLSKFIIEYIYKEGWTDLRDIQVEAIEKFNETSSDLVISSKTASGKTEAAFFPVFSYMEKNPKKGIQCLYVSPLKALINDQFDRIKDILEESNLNVFKWHGDVSDYHKKKAIDSYNSILQITPESIESLFINHYSDLRILFNNLEYIIIDEIHYFIENERGIHLIALLDRLMRLIGRRPRFICLSATLSNIEIVKDFIGSTDIEYIYGTNTTDRIRLLVDADYYTDDVTNYYTKIYKYINGKKSILFANSRAEVESLAVALKKRNEAYSGDNYILVHHGSISKELRLEVEKRLKEDNRICAVATNTLELGIDIGSLERIVQTETCFNVNSFVQRLGRSGRKNNPKEMVFVHKVEKCNSLEISDILNIFPNEFIYNLAMIECYTNEKYLEPLTYNSYPYQVFVLELLSHLSSHQLIERNKLGEFLISLIPFKNISYDDYSKILDKLINMDIIIEDDDHLLILSEKGERLICDFHIYAIFQTIEEYDVYLNDKLIGSINEKPIKDKVINLAGQALKIIKIDVKNKKVFVEPSKEYGSIIFKSDAKFIVENKLMNKVEELLEHYRELPYLTESAKNIYYDACLMYQKIKENTFNHLIRVNNGFMLIPFLGTKDYNSLFVYLKKHVNHIEKIKSMFYPLGYYIEGSTSNVCDVINNIHHIDNENIKDYEEMKQIKFNQYIPFELLEKEYSNIYLNSDKNYENIKNKLKL